VKKAHAFDLTGWSLAELKEIPIEIVWALLRVSHISPTPTGTKLQAAMDVKAKEYTRLMALKGMSSNRELRPSSLLTLQTLLNSPEAVSKLDTEIEV